MVSKMEVKVMGMKNILPRLKNGKNYTENTTHAIHKEWRKSSWFHFRKVRPEDFFHKQLQINLSIVNLKWIKTIKFSKGEEFTQKLVYRTKSVFIWKRKNIYIIKNFSYKKLKKIL